MATDQSIEHFKKQGFAAHLLAAGVPEQKVAETFLPKYAAQDANRTRKLRDAAAAIFPQK